jgi:3-dehydroquinate synthase class II
MMATADESMLLNSVSKDLNSETPERPYVVVASFRVFSNKGTRQISSTSK